MGASHSSEFSSNEIQEFSKHYSLVKSSYDYRFGQIAIYQHNESRQLVLVNTRSFENQAQRNDCVQEIRQKQVNSNPSVAKIIGYSLASGSNICGLNSSVTVYTEFYQDDLLRELRTRQRSGERYTEQEVWYLIETLISALSFQQEQNVYHGDLNPQNIILTNNGQAKILNNGIVSLYRNNFVRRLQGQTNLYLAPEAIELVNSKSITPQYNQFKADIYSLGITLLYVLLLQDPIMVYNFQFNTVQHEQVDALLNQALELYSYSLIDFVRSMLMQDPIKRPSALELRGRRPQQIQPQLQQSQRVVQAPFQQQPLMVSQPMVQQPMISQPMVQQPMMQRGVQQQVRPQVPLNQSSIRNSMVGGRRY